MTVKKNIFAMITATTSPSAVSVYTHFSSRFVKHVLSWFFKLTTSLVLRIVLVTSFLRWHAQGCVSCQTSTTVHTTQMISWDCRTWGFILADRCRTHICAHCCSCSCIIRLTLGSTRYLTVNNSCSSHCYSLNLFFLCWFVAWSTLCAISLRLVHLPHCLHSLLHQNVMIVILLNFVTHSQFLTSSAYWPLLGPSIALGFFLMTFKTLFLRASLSLLSLFYFHVKSRILLSRLWRTRHLSNMSYKNL